MIDGLKPERALLDGGFSKITLAVVGDIILDHYVSGDAARISSEAPVPVLRVRSDKYVLGGAGNLAMNLRGLGVNVKILGRVGDDEAGHRVLALFDEAGADCSGIWLDGSTTIKTRVLGGDRQQMLRIDREEIFSPPNGEDARVLKNIRGVRAVVLSDYGNGVFRDKLAGKIISVCKEKYKISTFIDPRGSDWERYRGASMVAPNLKELSDVTRTKVENDDEQVVRSGNEVRNKFGIASLLTTRSDKGATLIDAEGVHHERASVVDVYDVSGAGDTMLATVAAFVTAGVSAKESVRLANAASQIVIGKVGTCPITAHELLKNMFRMEAEKVVPWGEARSRIGAWRAAGERVIFTNGCFDIFHAGHADSLSRARALGDRLVVGLNSDSSVKKLKGETRPINDEDARSRVLSAMSAVDCVVIFGENTPEELLSELRPDVIAKGGDYAPEQVDGRQYASEVVILPILEGHSTTAILRKML